MSSDQITFGESAMRERLTIYIDIAAFGHLFGSQNDSLWGLGELLGSVAEIGRHAPTLGMSRLFAHQVGDGVLLFDDSGTPNWPRALGIAVGICQATMMRTSHFTKGALAVGQLADVQRCYPESVRDHLKNGVVSLGDGLMTVFPVMGTALIRAAKLNYSRGATLAIESSHSAQIPKGFVHRPFLSADKPPLILIDWVHSESKELEAARHILGIAELKADSLSKRCAAALEDRGYSPEWVHATRTVLNL